MTSARVSLPALFLCALTVLVALAFSPPLFEPFLEVKELLLVAGAAAAAALWLAAGGMALPRTPVWAVLAVLAGAAALSPFRAAAAAHFAALLVLFVVAASVMREPAARAALAGAITAAGCIEAVYVLWQVLVGDPVFSTARLEGKWRAFGTLGNPNWAGEFLAVALLVAWGRYTARREAGERARAACLPVIAMGLAATFARGAWLACGVGALAFALARRKRPAAPGLLALMAIASAALVALLLAARPDTVAHLANIASLRGRVWMWIVTAAMIRAAPWGGCGLGAFALEFPRYQAEAFSRPWSAPFLSHGSFTVHAHNDLLQLWAEAGLAAAVALAALAWIAARRGRALATDPLTLGCWAALMALLVDSAFATVVYLPANGWLLAVLLGTVEAAACRDAVWKFPSTAPARAAACLLAAVLCATAWPYCWGRARADAALGRASAALGRGDLAVADAALQAAFRYAPDHMEAWSLAGRLRFLRGQYPASAEASDRALRLGYDADVFEAKAGALWKSGRRAEAVAVLEELVRLRPGLPWAARELKLLRAASSRP